MTEARCRRTGGLPGEEPPGGFEVPLEAVLGRSPGIGLDVSNGAYLRVCEVNERGLIPEYNARVGAAQQVRAGDFIVAVNGVRRKAVDLMMDLVVSEEAVTFSVLRPFEFDVVLDRTDCPLGLDVNFHQRSRSVVVMRVLQDGAVAAWNARVEKELRIKVSDHIVAVCGRTGSASELLKRLAEEPRPTLAVRRPLQPSIPV